MKLADDSRLKFEAFFRETYGDKRFEMPTVYFYAGGFSRSITNHLHIHGITVGRKVFVAPTVVSVDKNLAKINVELAAHEIAHVLQYRREGFIKFFYKYFSGYWRNLKQYQNWDAISRHLAYLDIPFEIEARAIATEFVEWNRRNEK